MTDQIEEKKIYAEARGNYSWLSNKKYYNFTFSLTSTLEESYAEVTFLKDQIFREIERKNKEEKEKSTNNPEASKAE